MFICNNSGHKLENLIYFHLLCDVQRERRESAHPVFKLVVRDCATLPHVFFFLLSRPIWCTDSFQRLMTSSIFGECIQIEWKNIQINMITDCFFLAATLCCAQCNADLFTTEIFNLSPPVGVQNGFCLHEKCIGSIVFVLLLCLHLCRPGRIGKLITRSLF